MTLTRHLTYLAAGLGLAFAAHAQTVLKIGYPTP